MELIGSVNVLVAVFGAGGQTGYYLCQELLDSGHSVIGIVRNKSRKLFPFLQNYDQIVLDLSKQNDFQSIFLDQHPDVIVNLAGLSSVLACESSPEISYRLNFELVKDLINYLSITQQKEGKKVFYYQASSSEMYTANRALELVDESTALSPHSTYGSHKSLAHQLVQRARNDLGVYASNMILFNHESPRRPSNYVSRKITKTAYEISLGISNSLVLGNVNTKRDWAHAQDYAHVIKRLIDSSYFGDFVIASGVLRSIKEFVEVTFDYFNLRPTSKYLAISTSLSRKNDHPGLRGETSNIRSLIGELRLRNFEDTISDMCEHEKLN